MLRAPGYGFSGEAGPKLRHVVFIDRTGGRKRALNLAPAKDETAAAVFTPCQSKAPQSRQSPQEFAFIKWLFDQAGLDIHGYGDQTLTRRLPSCLRVLRTANVTD